jgi:hypothetical protein
MTESYDWEIYLSAVYETDNAKMAGRILEARSAIEQRLLSPIDDDERESLEWAMEGIETLRAERALPNSNPDRNSGSGSGKA